MAIEKCKNCGGIHFRNAPCPPALLAKKSASAVKPVHLPRMTDRSGESRKDRVGQAKKSTGGRKSPTTSRARSEQSRLGQELEAPVPVDIPASGQELSVSTPAVTGIESEDCASDARRTLAAKRKDTRRGDRHKPGYWKTYQRKDRLK